MVVDLYRRLVREYGWSLKDIDDTNLETLFDFLLLEVPEDENMKIIGGKTYFRAPRDRPPAWL